MLKEKVLKHPRNNKIKFKFGYFVDGERFKGITSFLGKFFAPFDKMKIAKFIAYRDGVTVEEVLAEWEADRQYGSYIDKLVDDYIKYGIVGDNEMKLILDALKEKDLTIIANEWMIYNEDIKKASAVDLVCERNGQIVIVDLKSMKKPIAVTAYKNKKMNHPISSLPDSKFYQQSLQVGMYKDWIQDKYGLPVSDEFYVLRVRPSFYEWVPLMDVQNEIKKLYEYEKSLLSNTV